MVCYGASAFALRASADEPRLTHPTGYFSFFSRCCDPDRQIRELHGVRPKGAEGATRGLHQGYM
jgi:hypothetical protein